MPTPTRVITEISVSICSKGHSKNILVVLAECCASVSPEQTYPTAPEFESKVTTISLAGKCYLGAHITKIQNNFRFSFLNTWGQTHKII